MGCGIELDRRVVTVPSDARWGLRRRRNSDGDVAMPAPVSRGIYHERKSDACGMRSQTCPVRRRTVPIGAVMRSSSCPWLV